MFVMNRTVFVGTEGGPNSILMVQQGLVYVVKQTRASYNFLLFIILCIGPQWPILIYNLSHSLFLTSIFTAIMAPLLWIWVTALRAFFKNPRIRIDSHGKRIILEKGRIQKKHVILKPEHIKSIQIVYTIYQDSQGNTLSNFVLDIVSPAGKSRSLCISDNLYLIRKIGLRMQDATGVPFDFNPVDDPAYHNLWTWRSERKRVKRAHRERLSAVKVKDQDPKKERRSSKGDRRKQSPENDENTDESV